MPADWLNGGASGSILRFDPQSHRKPIVLTGSLDVGPHRIALRAAPRPPVADR
jgi:hypothetical protein